MNSKRRSALVSTSLVAVLAAILGVSGAHAEGRSTASRVEGSWHVTLEVPPDPQNPAGLVFQALETYARGGAVIGSNNNNNITPGSVSHGTWVRRGGGRFSSTSEGLTFNPILKEPGILKVNDTIEVDGDTYTGVSIAFFCDINGDNCIELGPADTSGRRIKVENLD